MGKCLIAFGTRPEAIKLAPVVKEAKKCFDVVVCVTSQHRELLDGMLSLFNIEPDYDLDVMTHDQSPSRVVAAVLPKMEEVIRAEAPDVVLVQGDTSSALASALAAHHCKVCVGHVEAGLRTGRRYDPFPEELNRKMITDLSTLHFAPTEIDVGHLRSENISNNVFLTGNTVVDALKRLPEYESVEVYRDLTDGHPSLPYVVVTSHRRENHDRMHLICQAVRQLAVLFKEYTFVWPVHKNPNVAGVVFKELRNVDNVLLVDSMGYSSFIRLMKGAKLLLSDSGGVQEEACTLGVPVVILREVTERHAALSAGAAVLAGTDPAAIVNLVSTILRDALLYTFMAGPRDIFGTGDAAEKIVLHIKEWLGKEKTRFV